jgi:hypothetical protein
MHPRHMDKHIRFAGKGLACMQPRNLPVPLSGLPPLVEEAAALKASGALSPCLLGRGAY